MADTLPLANVPQRGDQSAAPLVAPSALPAAAPDEDVNVISPRGRAGTIKGADVPAALQAGYQLEDNAATHQRILQKKYGDAPISAGLLGAARGATFGLSDLAARGLGAREDVEAIQRFNPWASTIGEIGGAVAGSFLPGFGAVGELGHGVQEATAGSHAIAALAEGGKFSKVAARYAPTLVRGATEGAIYGAGGGLSHAALSSDPMTAEAVLGDMATGALLGAGTGAALSAGGKFLADSARWVTKAHAQAATPTIADEVLAHSAATEPGVVADAAAAAPAAPRQTWAEFTKGKMGPYMESEGGHAGAMKRLGAEWADYKAGGGIPVETAPSGLAEGSGPVRAAAEVPDAVVEDFKTKYNEMTRVSRQQVRTFERSIDKGGGFEISDPEAMAALRSSGMVDPALIDAIEGVESARAKTHSMLPLEGNTTGMRTYEESSPMFGGEGERGGSYAKGQGKISMQWTADNAAVADAARAPGFRDALIEHQAAIDRAQSLLPNHRAYPPIIEAEHPLLDMPGAAVAPKNGLAPETDRLLSGLGKADLPRAQVVSGGGKRLSGAATKSIFGVEPPTAAESKLADRVTQALHPEEAAPRGGPTSLRSRVGRAGTAVKRHLGSMVGAGIGSMTGLGPWVGGYIGRELLTGPIHAITEALAGRAGGGMGRLASAVDSVVGGKGAAIARKTATGILGGVSFAVSDQREKPKGTPFQQRSAEMVNAVANPSRTRSVIHQNLAGVRAADPMLSDQMEELAFTRLMFLSEKMPRDPGAGARLGKRPPWEPTDAETSKWARYVDAAEHPEHVIHAVAAGTVTMEQVETLERLYPTTYQRVRSDIVARAAELQATLPWDKRLALSVLFHAPVDDVMQPQHVLAMQQTFADMAAQKQQAGPSPMAGTIKPPSPTRAQQLAAH